jgi:hypothetical protein
MANIRLRLLLAVLLLSTSLHGAIFIVPDDRELIDRSDAVIIGTPRFAWSHFGDDGTIYTTTDVMIDQLLRGTLPREDSIRITTQGGRVGDLVYYVSGVPKLMQERRYLLFISCSEGIWSVEGEALGAFEIIEEVEGLPLALRGGDEGIGGWDGSGRRWAEPQRDAGRFIEFIRRSREDRGDYLLSAGPRRETAAIEPQAHVPASAYCAKPQGLPFRRSDFDSGGSVGFGINGTHPGFSDTEASVGRAMDAWNGAPGSTIRLVSLGASTSPGMTFDGTNTIRLGTSLGGNLAGRASLWAFASNTHEYDGETFLTIVESDIVVDQSYGETVAEEILAHELGHAVGFRHSDVGTPASGNAVMTSALSILRPVLGANLQQWDLDAVSHVYAAVTCQAPSITTQPQSQTISPGLHVTVSVAVSATAPITYQWYRGITGDLTQPVGNNSSSYGDVVWTTTSFWVRVTNSCGTASSATATITVESACNQPVISLQPASQTVSAGGAATLVVAASGTIPFSYQWYRGSAGDTSAPVGSGTSSFDTGSLSATSSYWVRVGNACGSVDSATAVITVESGCMPPSILQPPISETITAGTGTTLSVISAGSTPLIHQWYRGESGDVSHPIGSGSSTLSTGPLTVSSSFWVEVSNACGTVASAAAVITVVSGCTPPVIIEQPQSQSVVAGGSATLQVTAAGSESMSYQWYRGGRGETAHPVGINSRSFSTGPLSTATSFWVRITNACGVVESITATVSVTIQCSLTITTHPSSQTIRAGEQARLRIELTSVTEGGLEGILTYGWFQGSSGDTSTPLPQFTTGSIVTEKLTKTASYWVRVSNGCTALDSSTAVVEVFTTRKRGAGR